MTEQEHLEVSRKLALAIGWKPEQMRVEAGYLLIKLFVAPDCYVWRTFDYRNELIAFRVAEKFDCFPRKHYKGWEAFTYYEPEVYANTPALAIALAVIAAKGVK